MKNTVYYFLIFAFCSIFVVRDGFAQGVYFDPEPTDVTAPARLYIDITSSECNCPELLDADPETNPLFIWTWDPNEARPLLNGESDVTNGQWGASNPNLQLQQDESDPNLWYFDFLGASMAQFYDRPAAVFYDTGIFFLVKEENGAPADLPEQKSPDINIIPEPPGCFEKVCPFPTTFFQDEFFIITYDNNQETNSALQDLGPDECLIWYRIGINGGPLQVVREETDKFKMKYDGEGIFSITMIPEEYFELQEGDELTRIDVFITISPIDVPPFTTPVTLTPGCE
jgi:hypothetical protein